MKRTIVMAVLASLILGTAVSAQTVKFSDRVGAVLVTQDAASDSDASLGYLYNRFVGGYDHEKFSLWGRAQVALQSSDQWKDNISFNGNQTWFEFNGAIRPLKFMEFAVGNSFGKELPWSGYELPGAYGYGSDASYGVRKYASGNGMAMLFRGSGTGIPLLEGLTIGWNSLPLNVVKAMGKSAWTTGVGVNYTLMDALTLSFGGQFDTASDANQTIGFYGELLAIENMKANLGITIYTNTSVVDPSGIAGATTTTAGAGSSSFGIKKLESGVVSLLNAGVHFTMPGFPLYLGADMGIVTGKQVIGTNADGDVTMMPILVGGLIGMDVTERFYTHVRVSYGDNLASESSKRASEVVITPRLHYKTKSWGELRLDPGFTIISTDADTNFGFSIGMFWEYKY
jgi:opacity protein-like surface antigen